MAHQPGPNLILTPGRQASAPAAPIRTPSPTRPKSQSSIPVGFQVFADDAVKGSERLASAALEHFPSASAEQVLGFVAAMAGDPATSNAAFVARDQAKAAQAKRAAADAVWSRARSRTQQQSGATDAWDRARAKTETGQ